MIDLSLNQVLMRSVNTSLVVLLPILSLLLFGGDTLKDFAFAMFVGVAIGAYSSVFIAAPLFAVLKKRESDSAQLERARRVGAHRGTAGGRRGRDRGAATGDGAAARRRDRAARATAAHARGRRPKRQAPPTGQTQAEVSAWRSSRSRR